MSVKIYSSGSLVASAGSMQMKSIASGSNNSMHIFRGGTTITTWVNRGGEMYIFSGGVASNTYVSSGGAMHIYSGGVAKDFTLNVGGQLGGFSFEKKEYWSSYVGGVTEISDNVMIVDSRMLITSGGTANSTTVSSGGSMYISSGGVANRTWVSSGGSMHISSGGVANRTNVYTSGSMRISSGGVANDTRVYDGTMSIVSGGVANNTEVDAYGAMYLFYGGVANSTTVGVRGYMMIDSGCVANDTTMSGGDMSINSGGTALNVTWTPCIGNIYVEDGAHVTYTSKYSGVYFGSNNQLLSHTQVMDNKIVSGNKGSMYVMSGGVANSTTVNSGGYMYISSGGVANSTTVNSGVMYISSGGVANSTTVNSSGWMYINSGGKHTGSLQMANGARVSAYKGSIIDFTVAERTASDGYLINNLSLISGTPTYTITVSAEQADGTYKLAQGAGSFTGSITIGDGTTSYGSITVNGEDFIYNDTTYSLDQVNGNLTLSIRKASVFIYSSGTLTSSGAVIDNATLANGGDNSMHISSGGVANSTTVNSVGYMHISSGGVANSTTVNSRGYMHISSGGVANRTMVNRYGAMYISSGGTAMSIKENGGYVSVGDGANVTFVSNTINGITITYRMTVHKNTIANRTKVNSGGVMVIYSGGVANSTTVYDSSGGMHISSGGVANSTTVIYGGDMDIFFGGVANNTTVNSGGGMSISSGGVANDTAVNDGWMDIFSGGTANSTTVNSYCEMIIASGGTATDITALDGAILFITVASNTYIQGTYNGSAFEMKDAYISGYTVNYGAWMNISSGGVANDTTVNSVGRLNIHSGGVANNTTVNDGGMHIHGGVANNTTVNDGWMNICSGGTANSTTVNSSGYMHISSGGVANSTTVNSGGSMYISSGGKHTGSLQIANGASVSVKQSGIIDFTIADRTANDGYLINDLSLISGTPTYTITVLENQVFGEYKLAQGAGNFSSSISIGDGTTSYGSITVNGDVFKYNGVDYQLTQQNGNLHLTIDDFTPPAAPTYTVSNTALTNQNVTVSAVFSNDSVVKQYSLNGKDWQTYTDGIVFTENGIVSFRSQDAAGNFSEVVSYQVSNIDKVAPTLDITADKTAPTNQNVVLTATVSDGTVEYYDGKNWVSGSTFEVSVNGTYQFRVTDEAGNSVTDSIVVNNIDKVAPTLDITADKTAPTNQNVILTATVSDGTVEYYDGKNWVAGSTFEVSVNGTYQFRVTDAVGNSVTDSIVVNNIDKVAPTLDISADKTAPTNQNVVLTATVSDGTVEYYDGKNWVSGSTFEVSANGTYQFRVTDAAGNSVTDSIVVNNIDKVAPTLDITADKTALTNQNVVLTATVSDGTVEYYDGKNWVAGSTFEVTENGTYQFRVTDAAGNSVTDSIVVNNIDKVAPTLDISADKTAPTNQNVVLTATVSDGTVEYFANGKWNSGNSLTVTENGTYQFRVTDAAGNSVTDSIIVSNIDKVAPTLEVSGNVTEWTNNDVVLSATASDGTIEYFDGENWVAGSTLTVTQNGTYQFRVTDLAGNITETSVVVDKIDKTAPDNPVASADIISQTRENVTVTATFAEDSVKNEYSLDGKIWNVYTEGIVFDVNGTVYFRSTDHVGNISETVFEVTNIDKVAPTLDITADKTAPTNQNVVLTATVSDGTVEYFANGKWNTGNSLTVTENGTYQFRVTDTAGNSVTDSIIVSNIDKVAPTLDISADKTAPTNQNVVLTATVSDGTVEYFADGKWNSGNSLTVTENGTYQFRVTDAAGNSVTDSIIVSNIDKVAPTLDITADKTAPTNQNVVLTATVSDGTVEYYDGKNWVTGSTFEVSANGTYQFRVIDEAGNSVTDSIVVNNIDKVAPTLDITADKTVPTNQNVVLTATVSDGTVEYYDGKNWVAGSTFEVTANGTYQFRVTDAAGNSVTDSIVVNNIDKVAPTLDITADKTAPTNQNVVLTATVSDGTVEYYDGKNWVAGSTFEVSVNGTYQFRVTDEAGNTVTDSIVVNNIDKVAPTLDITADKTAPTNQNVVLTATVSDGTVEYFANGKWNTGNSLTVTENGTYQFRVTDTVGNSVTDSIVVNNIDKVAPTLEISGNATDWTNKNVILKATVSDGRVEHFDGEFWVSGSTFEVSANGTYQFRVTDAAGNVTQKSVTVNKIDKIAPDKPVAKADITSVTTGNVTVSATFAEDSVRNEYSFNVRTWLTYSREIVFDENGTVYFRSTDAAGNVSAITKYAVTNIDRVGPDKPVASADILELTNQNVTVSAVFSNDSAIKQYSFDGQNWQTYTQGVVFEQNGTIYFRSYDASGNVSPTASYEVANIDKVAPTLEISGNVTEWTNEDVVLTAAVSDGTVEYFANGKWNAGAVFTAAENGTYQFRVTDAAGNVTQKSVVVDKIDKTAPVIDNVEADITEITHFDVKVTADFSDNNGFTAQYKINDGEWIDYLDGVIMSENGTVYFKAADEAGNETYAEYTVSNIDKLAPDMPIVTVEERGYISNDPIIVSAVFAENSALKQYSFNGVDWFDYTDALYVRTNGEVFFRSCDIAGNYSPVATAVVKEIDDTADSALTEYIFVNAKYSEKNTSNKEQNGIPLVYGENAFNTLYDFKHSADEKIVMLDAAVNIFNNTDLTDIGIMAANVSVPKKKMTVNSYSYSAKSSVRGKLNINGKDTGSVIFENFATVNLSNSAHVNSIEGGKSSSTYTVKTSYKQGVKNETVTHKITKSASGKAVLSSASADVLSNYSLVTLDGSSVGKIENNAYKLTETVKTVGSTVVNSKRTEQFSAGGTVVLKNNSVVESVKNYKTVKITDSKAGAISNFAVAKIVNGTETRKVSGSVSLVRAEADTIENYSKVTMTDSHIGNALNVQRVTASKGFNTLEKFVGTVGNDTLTIGKNAVLVLNGADFGEGKDKFVNSGTLIFGSDFEINAETLSGKGNFAATSEVYEKLSGKVSGLLNLGQTYEGFRNSKYELADNTEKKAVKWDMKSDYNGWLNSDIGFEDTVDFIKFKAKENSVIKISGEFSGGTDKITLNGSVLTADADGNYIAMVSAKTDYILKLERNEMNSVNYEISLIA